MPFLDCKLFAEEFNICNEIPCSIVLDTGSPTHISYRGFSRYARGRETHGVDFPAPR